MKSLAQSREMKFIESDTELAMVAFTNLEVAMYKSSMMQATVSYMKFSKKLTKYNVNVVTRTLRLDSKYVHAEES